MRKLMWFVIGFAVSCGLCAYGRESAWMLPGGIAAVVLTVGFLFLFRRKELLSPAIGVLAGCIGGLVWFSGFYLIYLHPVSVLEGQEMQLTVTSTDYSYETDYSTCAEGTARIADRTYQIRLYLTEETQAAPGDRLTGVFRLRLTMPREGENSTWLQGKGIFLTGYQRGDITLEPSETMPIRGYPALLRHRITKILQALFPEELSAFAKALLLGDARDLSYSLNTAFKISGIRHIVAVSGLHISIVYSLICLVTLRRRFLTAVVGMPLLLLFAAVAGFTPSALRACIMVWLMMLAMVFDREYDPPTALSFAVLVMLMGNPLAVTSVSLQLSAGCVAGIQLFQEPINKWLKQRIPEITGFPGKLRSLFCGSISVSLSASSLITPLCAWYFGTVSLVGILTNLLTLWVVNLVFIGLVIACVLWPVWSGGAVWMGKLLAWPIRYVMGAANVLASFPLAAVYTKSIYVIFWLVFLYVLLAVFLTMKKKRPGVLLCSATLGLCAALLASWWEPLAWDTSITMLDVGQGQAILLQTEGKTILVDCGGDSGEDAADIVAQTLLSQGITRLHGIVITHYDEDHFGGLAHLLTRVDTDYLFVPDTRGQASLPETSGKTVFVWDDLELRMDAAVLRIFGPVYSGSDNENSLCVLFDTEKCDILITGDRSAFGERMLMRGRDLPDVDVLVAGHHGAAESTSDQLLQTVTPEIVLISVKKDNIYGHPSEKLLQRLAESGCAVLRTDEQGTITIRR